MFTFLKVAENSLITQLELIQIVNKRIELLYRYVRYLFKTYEVLVCNTSHLIVLALL